MKNIEELDELPPASNVVKSTSELGIGVILPSDTIADTAVEVDGKFNFQPGILPTSLSQLMEMCALDEESLQLIRAEIELFPKVHSEKTLGRVNDRGQQVYDEWGLLNPENLFVLLSLLSKIARFHKEKLDKEKEKIRILTLGTGSGLTDMAMYRILTHFGVDFEIHTLDFRKDEDGERKERDLQIPLDKRNAGYGPLPERGIGHEIEKIRQELGALDNVIRHHRDSAEFLDRAIGDPVMANSFDLVSIDDNHQFQGAIYSIAKSSLLLKQGGITFLDDFGGSKLATNGGVSMAAFNYAAHTNQFGYFVSNPGEVFSTNAAFFIKSKLTAASNFPYSLKRLFAMLE